MNTKLNVPLSVTDIVMPKNCRYMSEDKDLMTKLPLTGKSILNKRLPGCGGTSMFLEYPVPLVLVAPRTNILVSKNKQYPDSHLFRDSQKKKISIIELKANLRNYLTRIGTPFNLNPQPFYPKILVTVDSFKYVIEVLNDMGKTDEFLFLVDEFQNLMSDATFKGKTDMEFLYLIDSKCKNIIYMSATPIDHPYLSVLDQFKGLSYYALKWDPAILEAPNIKEIDMKGSSPGQICAEIIRNYRARGYFEVKKMSGQMYYAKEIVIFLNSVQIAKRIILDNNLQPSETTIMVSESNRHSQELEKLGYKIGGLCTDKGNPKNKTFTFCSKASFEGTDFYSTNAATVIFIDGTNDCQMLDVAIDLLQIMGRQRLYSNPFRRDAKIYYKTKKNQKSMLDMEMELQSMLDNSYTMLQSMKDMDEKTRMLWISKLRDVPERDRYKNDYLDVFDTLDGPECHINWLVMVAKTDIWQRQSHIYCDPVYLKSGISNALSQTMVQKPQCLVDFENAMYETSSFQKGLRLYVEFLEAYPYLYNPVLFNPYISLAYDEYCHVVPVAYIKSVQYREKEVVARYRLLTMGKEISDLCTIRFAKGHFYTKPDAKRYLQEIYDNLQIEETAKASDLQKYIQVTEIWRTINGKRVIGYGIS